MSEYSIINIDLQEEEALLKALSDMGYKPQIHKESQKLRGYQGDLRKQKAHVVVPKEQVGSASNDVGFERVIDEKGKRFVMHLSEYDQRSNLFNSQRLKQLYAKHRIKSLVNRTTKYSYQSERVEKDGTIKIKLVRR